MKSKNKTIRRELDSVFSMFIRTRNATNEGIVQCFTCNAYDYWWNMDCGHFIKRQNMAVRFNEKNCQIQCKKCNWLLQGNDVQFEKNLIKFYGENPVLLLKSRHKLRQYKEFELILKIQYYLPLVMERIDKIPFLDKQVKELNRLKQKYGKNNEM